MDNDKSKEKEKNTVFIDNWYDLDYKIRTVGGEQLVYKQDCFKNELSNFISNVYA